MTEAEGARALFKQVADRVDERLFGVREPLAARDGRYPHRATTC